MEKIELTETIGLTNREKELYRTLRTNIEFTGVENKVIAITSCSPNDGKSTISYNLAAAFAESGKHTLFIDADMRRSVFAQRYNISGNLKGLSHLLSGQSNLQEVIHSTNKKNLFLIPAGVFSSNPTKLLGNKRLQRTIEAVREAFDYVVIDTPPLGSVIDAAVLAKHCDASCMVLASNTSSKAEARSVLNQLRTANPNFLGVVLNKVDVKMGSYYARKYGYYYYGKDKGYYDGYGYY